VRMGLLRLAAPLGLFALGALVAAAALAPTSELAGRYTHRFRNGDVSGAHYMTTDEVVIVPMDARRAFVSFGLSFFNGHECSIDGVARVEGRRLVLHDAEAQGGPDDAPCTLTIWHEGAWLHWDDHGGTCQSNCGARGSFEHGGMAWSSRRPVPPAAARRLLRGVH
jgi:hypothetical protein